MLSDDIGDRMVSVGYDIGDKTTKEILRLALKGLIKLKENSDAGKQSLKKLDKTGDTVSAVEVDKSELREFNYYAKKYHLDYSLVKQTNDPNKRMLFFKFRDMEKMSSAITDAVNDKTLENDSLTNKLIRAKERATELNQARSKEKVKHKNRRRNQERSL